MKRAKDLYQKLISDENLRLAILTVNATHKWHPHHRPNKTVLRVEADIDGYVEKLREGLDVAPVTDRAKGKADAARRAQLIDLVNKAVDGKADELLAGGKDGSIYDALLDEVKNGRAKDAQEELDRLMTAGKDKGSIKSKITESVKEEYLAGSDRDREKLEKKLLALEDAEGKPLYEEKNFAQWVSAADKKAEKAKDEKNWWEGVK